MSDGRQDNELDISIGKASAVMRQLYLSVILKRELCAKAKLSIFKSVFVPILTYGYKCWATIEKVRSQVQAAKVGFLQKVRGLSMLDKVKNTDIFSIFQHQTTATLHRTIATSLVWPWDTSVSRTNSKAIIRRFLSGKKP